MSEGEYIFSKFRFLNELFFKKKKISQMLNSADDEIIVCPHILDICVTFCSIFAISCIHNIERSQ